MYIFTKVVLCVSGVEDSDATTIRMKGDRVHDDQHLVGPPNLVGDGAAVEVSPTFVAIDVLCSAHLHGQQSWLPQTPSKKDISQIDSVKTDGDLGAVVGFHIHLAAAAARFLPSGFCC